MQTVERVVSFVGREQLDIASWHDVTGDFSRLAHVSNFTRVKVVVTCIPEDEDAGESWTLAHATYLSSCCAPRVCSCARYRGQATCRHVTYSSPHYPICKPFRAHPPRPYRTCHPQPM